MSCFAMAAVFAAVFLGAGCDRDVRQPAVAGSFYPENAAMLKEAVDGYFRAADKAEVGGKLVALIVPHAGYKFSGGVAGVAYKQVEGADYDTVVVIGPAHKYSMKGISVFAGDAVLTPVGEIAVDKQLAASIIDKKNNILYEPLAHNNEHSVEVQFPFIQRALPNAKVVPIVIGAPDEAAMDSLARSLARAVGYSDKKKVLLVISTDWSHYKDYETARMMDGFGIEAVKDLSTFEIKVRSMMGQVEMCGLYPVMVAVDVANRLEADDVRLFKYANSGDVTGDKKSVVGYAAMGIYKTGKPRGASLTDGQKKLLLEIARGAVTSQVNNGIAPRFIVDDPGLNVMRGAFVTLKREGRLRGCIGNFFSNGPLYDTVRGMAVNAAVRDSRFRPVGKDELGLIEVEISVLSPLRKARSLDEIEVGRHGIYIIKGDKKGVLLPQVAVENGWDRTEFLRQVCNKAGLAPDDYKEGAEIYLFTALVFGEKDFK